MNTSGILRFVQRTFWWLILGPFIVTLVVIWNTRDLTKTYDSAMTVYTGVVSGYGIESEQLESQNWNILNNTLQNIMNIVTSKETLRKVSLQLYARCMIFGDPDKDNVYITAEHYRQLVSITPKEVLKLIDKSSEKNTLAKLESYYKPDRNNFVYGLFNWYHPHLSYSALQNIKVKRADGSDILEITYENNDPGIVYQTLDILNEVYVDQYKTLQFGTTNNVIKYFEAELARIGRELRAREDSLTDYNVKNRVINYDKQTEQVTALDRDYELRYQDVQSAYSSSRAVIARLELGIDENLKTIKDNSDFLSRLNRIADLNYKIAETQTSGIDSLHSSLVSPLSYAGQLQRQLSQEERDLKTFSEKYSNQKYTKEGYPTSNFVSQWVDELLKSKKAEAELKVLDDFKKDLDLQYSHFSPIGSTIKRQERSIDFTERSYLSILSSLNAARLRLKSLEMNSATLKVINPPTYPLDSKPSKRRSLVMAAAFGSFFFILGIFLLIELLDRTLRDRFRTERITSGKVIAALPESGIIMGGKFASDYKSIAAKYLANQLYGYFKPDSRPCIVNLLTLSDTVDDDFILQGLLNFWSNIGVQANLLTAGKDFEPASREFVFAQKIEELVPIAKDHDIVLVKQASLMSNSMPSSLLQEAAVNLLIVRADSVWKENDQILFDELIKQSGTTPVVLCLSEAKKSVVENFTGMLPPYTMLRRYSYRMSQLGFTSSANA
ncbi:MAG: hypothetical protein H6Q14_2359 [Bacteroidetes bacterium]|nr:hypothetical protein [Bacteroidota bacterium]